MILSRSRQGTRVITLLAVVVSGAALTGCDSLTGMMSSRNATSLDIAGEAASVAPAAALEAEMEDGTTSGLIDGLLNRQSILEPGPMRDVADAVMAANSRAAEADLRAATLRAEAKAMNWLPTIGPSVSLTSLGAVVTSLVVNQALVDFGGRRAERDYAKHDVEVAAVALAADSNTRVMEALELYLTAEAARARAAVNADAMGQMRHFAYVMSERVNAGISDRADLQVVQQKHNQMAADMASDTETAASALAELQAMAATPLADVHGVSPLAAPSLTAIPLTVMKAEAESSRAVAAARAARSGLLPGLAIGGSVGSEGENLGLTLGAANALGLGLGAQMEAIDAESEATAARVVAEREAADREIAALQGRLNSLRRQEAEARQLATQAAQNYALFAEQQRAGQRGVTEVVSVFETKVRSERTAVELRYDIILVELKIAERLGVLVDGERI